MKGSNRSSRHDSFSSYHHHPPEMSTVDVFYFKTLFDSISQYIAEWEASGQDPSGLLPSISTALTRLYSKLGNASPLTILGFSPTPSSDPPTAPSHPQEELRLLRTSFDTAFASLAGQVKELADKVNGSGPPPK